jgi:spermidine synthase
VGISIGAGPWVQRYIEGMVRSFDSRIVHMRESELQILTVLEQPRGRRELRGGSHVSGSTDPVRRQTQKLQSHLPMLLHPSPQRVLEIGYGVGELLRTILLYDPERVDLVELDPEMVSVANEWFEALNGRASEDRRVTVHTLDGRAFLRMSQQHYDVVMTDSMFLDSEGALRLYTTEHFQATRARLSSGGIALCWLPLNLDDRAARTVLKTFTQVFPETLVWVPLASNQVEAFLVGFEGRAQIDEREFRARYARYAAPDLAFLGWGEPLPALVSFRAAPADIAALVQGVGENRDRKPVLDFMRDDPTYALRDALLENSPTTLQQHLRLSASTWAQVRRTQQAETKASVVLRTLAGVPVEQRREGAAGFYATLESARALAPGHPAIEKALGRLAAERGPTDPASFATALEHDPYNFKANEHFAERALAQGDLARARMHVQRLTLMEPYFTRAAELRGPAP